MTSEFYRHLYQELSHKKLSSLLKGRESVEKYKAPSTIIKKPISKIVMTKGYRKEKLKLSYTAPILAHFTTSFYKEIQLQELVESIDPSDTCNKVKSRIFPVKVQPSRRIK